MKRKKAVNNIISLLYTIVIPIFPLLIHVFVNMLTNMNIKLEFIYPELFFATISICIESIKSLHRQFRSNDLKQLILFVLQIIIVLSSVSYGCILGIENSNLISIDTGFALLSSLIFFISCIIVYIAILIIREV